MTLFEELADLKEGQKREVLFCFDLVMHESEAIKQIKQLLSLSAENGMKIVKVEYGTTLKLEGKFIENKRHNKILITFEKSTENNNVNPIVMQKLEMFFRTRTV